jgi:hypothetical protein
MVDAEAAAQKAVEVAAREIERLADKGELEGFDAMNLARYADICLKFDDHRLTWMARLDPAKLPAELIARVERETAQADAKPERGRGRPRPQG